MAKEKEQDNGISESELIEVANSLDKIVAKPKAEGKQTKQSLPVGNFVAKVLSSFLNKSKDGTIYMNFKLSVYGYIKENDEGQSEVMGKMYGVHSKGFSLASDYCVNLLLDLFRDYEVVRTDGEPIMTGGDLLRSRGIPDGSWVVISVRTSKKGDGNFISGIFKPSLNLKAKAQSVYEKFCALNGNEIDMPKDEETTNEPDTNKDEPPF